MLPKSFSPSLRLDLRALCALSLSLLACEVTDGGTSPTAKTPPTVIHLSYPNASLGVFPRDRVLQIELSLPEADWLSLHVNALAEQYTPTNATFDGQSLGSVGLRFKGNNSLHSCFDAQGNQLCERLSMKLKFDEYEDGKLFYGLKRLVLNSTLTEWDLFREELSYRLFRDMSVIAPRTSYAVVTVNGVSQGIYTVVEEVDGRFTDDRFAQGDGNLFKEAWPARTDNAYYAFFLQTNAATADFATYETFSAEMLAANDSTLIGVLGKWMDVDYLSRYLAVDYAIANWDGPTTFYCNSTGCNNHNYYMYQEESAARFWLIPWDLNATFYTTHWLGNIAPWNELNVDCNARIPTTSGNLVTRPSACDPTIRALALNQTGYQNAVKQLLQKFFLVERLSAQIDSSSTLLKPFLDVDPFFVSALVPQATADLKAEIATLRTRLELAAP